MAASACRRAAAQYTIGICPMYVQFNDFWSIMWEVEQHVPSLLSIPLLSPPERTEHAYRVAPYVLRSFVSLTRW